MSNEKNEPTVLDQFVKEHPQQAAQNVLEGSSSSLPDAPLWPRLAARMMDGFFLFMLNISLAIFVRSPLAFLLMEVFGFCYAGYFNSALGGTPGKLMMGLALVDHETGVRLSFWKAGFRDTAGTFLSGLPLGLGYFLVFFTEGHRALHDLLFQTRVVQAPR